MDETRQPGIQIGQVFVLSARFEHGKDPMVLPPNTSVELQTHIELGAGWSPDDSQGFLTATVQTVNDENSLYRFHLQIVGLIVKDPDAPNMGIQEFATNDRAAILIPFLREALANLTGRGRFGPIMLKPINVKALIAGETRQPGTLPPPNEATG